MYTLTADDGNDGIQQTAISFNDAVKIFAELKKACGENTRINVSVSHIPVLLEPITLFELRNFMARLILEGFQTVSEAKTAIQVYNLMDNAIREATKMGNAVVERYNSDLIEGKGEV